jgi:hypothetical protein
LSGLINWSVEVALVIAVIVEASATIISALADMPGNAGDDQAGAAWHSKDQYQIRLGNLIVGA